MIVIIVIVCIIILVLLIHVMRRELRDFLATVPGGDSMKHYSVLTTLPVQWGEMDSYGMPLSVLSVLSLSVLSSWSFVAIIDILIMISRCHYHDYDSGHYD
jgi:hypothetical protein